VGGRNEMIDWGNEGGGGRKRFGFSRGGGREGRGGNTVPQNL